jgi:hypothetical protein
LVARTSVDASADYSSQLRVALLELLEGCCQEVGFDTAIDPKKNCHTVRTSFILLGTPEEIF